MPISENLRNALRSITRSTERAAEMGAVLDLASEGGGGGGAILVTQLEMTSEYNMIAADPDAPIPSDNFVLLDIVTINELGTVFEGGLTLDEDGRYEVSVTAKTRRVSNTATSSRLVEIQVNGVGTVGRCSATSSLDENPFPITCSTTFVLDASAGDVIRLASATVAGTQNATIMPGTVVVIKKIG